MEIEYKFLVDIKRLPALENGISITQGYLSDIPTVRVRTYGDKGFLTVKGKGMISREEYEYEIPHKDAVAMLSLCSKKIVKDRFIIPTDNKLKWEIDFFKEENSGLVLAEIEVPSEDFKFGLPEWIMENVSLETKYLNVNLAK